jgi:hypothetical protein
MDSARWERVQTLFHEAVDLPPDRPQRLPARRLRRRRGTARRSPGLDRRRPQPGASLLDRGVAYAANRVLRNEATTVQEIGP